MIATTDICIVSYNTPGLLRRMLESLMTYAPDESRIFLRVNEMSDADASVIAEYSEHIHFLSYGENIGYAQSVNLLAAQGQGEVIAIFNADIDFDSHAIQNCTDALLAHDDWGVLGPRSVNSQGKMTHAGIFGTNSAPLHRGWKKSDLKQFQDIKEAVTVSGSAYFIKREVWEELSICAPYLDACYNIYEEDDRRNPWGAFLPTDHYYEETFCSYHARAHGWKVVYYGPEKIIHEWHKSSPIGDPNSDGKMKKSQLQFRAACNIHNIECD